MSLAGLVQVHGAGLRRAQQVEASQGVAGQRLGALGGVTRTLLQEAGAGGERRGVAGRVEAGAPRDDSHLWPAGGRQRQKQSAVRGLLRGCVLVLTEKKTI